MNKHIFTAIAMALVLAACSDNKAAEESAASAAPAVSEPAASAPAAEAAATTGLEASCEAYIQRVESCVGKLAPAMGDQYKQGLEQTREALKTATSAQQAEICKTANDAFDQSAQMLKCD